MTAIDPRKVIVSVLERGEGASRVYRITLSYKPYPEIHAEAEDADYHTARSRALDVLIGLLEQKETA